MTVNFRCECAVIFGGVRFDVGGSLGISIHRFRICK